MKHNPTVLEIDHSRLDLFVVDPKSGKPYRHWLSTVADKNAGMVPSFCLIDRSPNYSSVMECLRNAILPKRYVENKLKGTRWEVVEPAKVEMPKKRKGTSISRKGAS